MEISQVVDIGRQALWLIIKCSAPMLIVSLVIGLAISIFQTVTSIQEQTLTSVPKMIGVFLTIMFCGYWILNNIVEFMVTLYSSFSTYVG